MTSAPVEESNLSSVRFRPDLGCRSLNRVIKLPYSELHIGTPHMESNHLFQFTTGEELHSSLRFSDNNLRFNPLLYSADQYQRSSTNFALSPFHGMDLIIYPRSLRAIAIFGFIRISSLLFTDETFSRPSRPFRYVTPSRVGSLEIPSLLRHPTCLIYLPQGGLASPSHTSIRAYPCDLLGNTRHIKKFG